MPNSGTEPRQDHSAHLRQVLFPALVAPLSMKIQRMVPLHYLQVFFGFSENEELAKEQDHEVVFKRVHTPDHAQYGLFQSRTPLSGYTLSDAVHEIGWNNANARMLMHFGHQVSPADVKNSRIMCLGSRFGSHFIFLEPEGKTWRLGFSELYAFRAGSNSLFLAWQVPKLAVQARAKSA